ncbi:tRNA (adenine(37)-N6)-methyltransferase isoform X1 [Genypterus blacodes]|uniref:tRNA (adenine(37)-N6)-methyltransferase isoform X1 n=1 Tax=Genypterus blacodes TaxID=154954 RepID=UPI003F76EE1A
MNSVCDGCGERINKLNQQVSIMRKEMKNLRQMLDSGIRSHRKHMTSIQSAVSTIGSSGSSDPGGGRSVPPPSPQLVLEQGNIQTVPIGYIRSCFSVKTGTPRQPTICGPSRAELRIQQSVFNNPDHALVGLEQYSHVWIIFLFHKNGHLSYKAKVKPPRLNGERVGVYSTRSPHRPNALGLTLAKLERIEGDTIHLSDIDMISGTPVLDIKPYIPEYDCPQARLSTDSDARQSTDRTQPDEAVSLHEEAANTSNASKDSDTDVHLKFKGDRTDCHANSGSGSLLSSQASAAHLSSTGDGSCSSSSGVSTQFSLSEDFNNVLEDVKAFVTQKDLCQLTSEDKERLVDTPKSLESVVERPCYGEDAHSTIAGWIREPPVASLQVRFTPQAQRELTEFLPTQYSGSPQSDGPRFKFLQSAEEAAAAIRGVLSADPRSVYRRTRCSDRLFYFTLDTADITCWFGQGFAEVLQVRPVQRRLALPCRLDTRVQ